MTPISPGSSLDVLSAFCLILILLIPFAAMGLALINTGLGRSRNAAHMMLASLCVMGVAAIVFFTIGSSLAEDAGRSAHALVIAGKRLYLIGNGRLFMKDAHLDGSPISLVAVYGLFAAPLAAMIPLGSGADRWKLSSACISAAIVAGFLYPLFAFWSWGGWLGARHLDIGVGYIDKGGAGPIQVLGGLTALAVTWVLGPRRGKYTPDRMPLAIPGHNAVYVLLGCFLAWIGWIGLDGAGTILFSSIPFGPSAVVLAVVNATLGATGAALTAALVTRSRYGKPDASLCANGWVAGLVATSAGCAYFKPLAALIVGAVAGALITYSVEVLELHFTIDDPGGTISVHAIAGIWGILAAGWFTTLPDANAAQGSQWIPQVTAVASLLGFVFPFSYGVHWLLNRIRPMRVTPEGERKGLDLHELGAGAYPDFMSHNDDLLQR